MIYEYAKLVACQLKPARAASKCSTFAKSRRGVRNVVQGDRDPLVFHYETVLYRQI